MASRFAVKSLDHVVLTVRSIPATVNFYTQRLGMKHEVFTSAKDPGVERHALLFGNQKINLHQSGREFEPKAQTVQPGSGDLCFLTDTKIEDVLRELKSEGIDVLEGGGIVDRTGAVGKLRSVYCRDPDGNLVEISNYV
ncbi:Glyoxalase/bleomycin resistance protein/dioxygenase [Macrophomina phaseolina MS6]|uniref:Glyoxalase/bleomycin resistance protein/dioxygenase n=1 Tax=Macrophomina phaseolina (strain MS6) TaxID=1126212 RepID=K2SFI1_MACPH|nr:Glyoxalase/bleomycin resistance protein/dioxygenase [Macrophomina phaseolina MS6]